MIPTNTQSVTVIDEVIGGFAAVAAESETVTSEILKVNDDDKSPVQPDKISPIIFPLATIVTVIAAKMAGVTMAKVVESDLAGKVFNRAYEIIRSYVSGEGSPITLEEFLEALNYRGLIDKLRQTLREYAQRHKITEQDLYSNTLDKIRENKAYRNIDDEYKIKLATRLTEGLLTQDKNLLREV